jgi:cytidine deaminase
VSAPERPDPAPDASAASAPPPADLLAAARAAWQNAYAPYSRFHVGAALRGRDGVVYAGSNVENASFGLARCAEQSAVQAMATAGERTFSELVVVTASTPPASPCGACRQVLYEFAPDATVWLVGEGGGGRVTSVRELLPDGFSLREDDGPPPA